MNKPKLLITGASGFLGWTVCRSASGSWRVYGLANTHPEALPAGIDAVRADLTSPTDRRRLLETIRPDAVIHLAAASKPNFCQKFPEQSRHINVDAAVTLAELCASMRIPFVFSSTDQVFDGTAAPYSESSPPSPINVYGEQKLEAERLILAGNPNAVVCRMPLMYGDASPAAESFLQPLLASLKAGTSVSLFVDEYRTVVGAPSAARGLLLAVGHRGGLLHLGGRQRLSRVEFGLHLAAAVGADPSRIHSCRQRDVPMPAPRPADVSLDSSKAFALGYDPLPVDRELAALECVRQWHG